MAFGLAVYASQVRVTPDPTQDSLPVAGQALLDGLSTRRVPTKGFKSCCPYISILLSQASLGAMGATEVNLLNRLA